MASNAEHDREHGEIAAKLEGIESTQKRVEKTLGKLANGKTVDLIMKGAVIVLTALEVQTRTGIELSGGSPEAFISIAKFLAQLFGG